MLQCFSAQRPASTRTTLRPQVRWNAFSDYTRFLDDDSLEGARIGVWRFGPAPTYNEEVVGSVVEPILDDVIEALEDEGADVIDDGTTDIDLSATAGEFPALLCEFKTDIATYLETYVDGTNPVTGQPYPQTLAELIEFNQDHPELEGPGTTSSSSSPRQPTGGTRSAPTSVPVSRHRSRTRSTTSWSRRTSTRSLL